MKRVVLFLVVFMFTLFAQSQECKLKTDFDSQSNEVVSTKMTPVFIKGTNQYLFQVRKVKADSVSYSLTMKVAKYSQTVSMLVAKGNELTLELMNGETISLQNRQIEKTSFSNGASFVYPSYNISEGELRKLVEVGIKSFTFETDETKDRFEVSNKRFKKKLTSAISCILIE